MNAVTSDLPGGFAAIDGTMPAWQRRVESMPVVDFIDYCLRGVGQVVFMNNPVTGLLILVGMYVGSSWLGAAGTLGLVVATLTALILGLDRGATRAGLYGFNGILVGAGLATFLAGEFSPSTILAIVALSAFSTVLHAALARVTLLTWSVPPFTLAFNITTLMFLIAAINVGNVKLSPLVAPGAPAIRDLSGQVGLRAAADAPAALDAANLANALLRGISQLFFADSVASGVVIILGILVASRIAAVFAVLGSLVGMLTGLAMGASGVAIYHGLWGFNSFDACLAIGGVFYVLTWRSGVFAVACAIITAVLFGAIGSLFAPWGLPALTLPFCFGTLAFVLVKDGSARLTPVAVADITTPEGHLGSLSSERGRHGPGRDATGEMQSA